MPARCHPSTGRNTGARVGSPPVRTILVWGTGLVVVLVVLSRLGHGILAPPPLRHPSRLVAWSAGRPPEVVAFAVLRLLAIGLDLYLLATMALGSLARLLGLARTIQILDWLSLPMVRRLTATFATWSLLTAGLGWAPARAGATTTGPDAGGMAASGNNLGPATGQHQPGAHRPPTTATTVSAPVMRLLPPAWPEAEHAATAAPRISPTPITPPAVAGGAVAGGAVASWTVRPGDNFWSIASATLERAWGRVPSDAEVEPYWLRVIAANRGRLAHPELADLIFPGQVFLLPVANQRPA